jgi:hypothetical protein
MSTLHDFEINLNRLSRRRAFIRPIVGLIFLAIASVLAISYIQFSAPFQPMIFSNVDNLLVTAASFGFMIVMIISWYLNKDEKTVHVKHNFERYIDKRIRQMEFMMHDIRRGAIPNQKEDFNLEASVDRAIASKLTSQYLEELVITKFEERLSKRHNLGDVYRNFAELCTRLDGEIQRMKKNAYVNLMIGIVATVFAICFLISLLFLHPDLQTASVIIQLTSYLPRISVAVVIEVFAFFFLRLYKANLFDVKYFSNEKTNVEMRMLALKTAIITDESDTLSSVVRDMSRTERNFIIKKDERSCVSEDENTEAHYKPVIAILEKLVELSKK